MLCTYIYTYALCYAPPCLPTRPRVKHPKIKPLPRQIGLFFFANPPVLSLSFFHLRLLNYSCACTFSYFFFYF